MSIRGHIVIFVKMPWRRVTGKGGRVVRISGDAAAESTTGLASSC